MLATAGSESKPSGRSAVCAECGRCFVYYVAVGDANCLNREACGLLSVAIWYRRSTLGVSSGLEVDRGSSGGGPKSGAGVVRNFAWLGFGRLSATDGLGTLKVVSLSNSAGCTKFHPNPSLGRPCLIEVPTASLVPGFGPLRGDPSIDPLRAPNRADPPNRSQPQRLARRRCADIQPHRVDSGQRSLYNMYRRALGLWPRQSDSAAGFDRRTAKRCDTVMTAATLTRGPPIVLAAVVRARCPTQRQASRQIVGSRSQRDMHIPVGRWMMSEDDEQLYSARTSEFISASQSTRTMRTAPSGRNTRNARLVGCRVSRDATGLRWRESDPTRRRLGRGIRGQGRRRCDEPIQAAVKAEAAGTHRPWGRGSPRQRGMDEIRGSICTARSPNGCGDQCCAAGSIYDDRPNTMMPEWRSSSHFTSDASIGGHITP